jgi:hypothetical protein
MSGAQRIDEVVGLLEAYVLGEIDLPRERVAAALKLLDLMVPDAPPWPDDGDVAPVLGNDQTVFAFPRKFSA